MKKRIVRSFIICAAKRGETEFYMINIAICDDNQGDSMHLHSLCKSCVLPDEISITTYTSGEELLPDVRDNKLSIVFLDVDMPGDNGIETGKKIRELDKSIIIIFYTSFPQYAIEAYDCEAFHYLLKPCSEEKLQEVLSRAVKKLGLMHHHISLRMHNRSVRLPISDIYYVEYCQKHVIYHTKDESFTTTGKFFQVYDELKRFGFYQLHQGYIVNLSKICDFRGYTAVLDNGFSVPISIRKKRDTLLAYAKYVEELS